MAMYFGLRPIKIIQRSKNLIPFPYNLREWQDPGEKGLEFAVNNDGTISLNGVATGKEGFSVFDYAKLDLVAGKKYWLSGVEDVPYCSLTLLEFIDGVWVGSYTCGRTAEAFTAKENATYSLSFAALYGATYNNALVKPMINEGSGPAPYGKKDNNIYFRIRRGVKKRNEKNLIPFPYAENGGTLYGVTYTINDDGVITLNGTSTEQNWYALKLNLPIVEGKTYTISGAYGSKGSGYWRVMIELYTADNKFLQSYASMDGAFTFTANAGTSYGNLYVYVGKGHTFNNQVFKPMINEGTKALPYYIEY